MTRIHYANENSLIIEQECSTWFINKKDDGIEIKNEFMTSDGYGVGMEAKFNIEEAKELFQFLKQNQFY